MARQLSNVIQFGFTGQNNLNAFNLLRAADRDHLSGIAARRCASSTSSSRRPSDRKPRAHSRFLQCRPTRQFGSWWTGLVLPLAYAAPGGDLEPPDGPTLPASSATSSRSSRDKDGIYLRCVAEEQPTR